MSDGPERLYARLTSGNPGTIVTVRDSVTASMTSIDTSADSLELATTGVEWKGQDRDSYNERIWATKAMAEMAHMRCSQGKVALNSVQRLYDATIGFADLVITTWRVNKTLPLAGPVLKLCRDDAMDALRQASSVYTEGLVAATDYLPTDELAQQDGDADDFKDYLRNGGLSEKEIEALQDGIGYSMTWGLDNGTLPGPVIADTEVTGNDDGLTPQGLGYSPANGGTMVQVSYGGKGDDTAVASIIDPDTGELINTVELSGFDGQAAHHVGSVVVDGNDVWITAGDPSRAIRYSLSDLKTQNLGSVAPARDAVDLKDGGHSFSTIHTDANGSTYLYAGNFWDDRMYRYEKVGGDWVRDDDYEVRTPEFTQGVVITDGEMSFSTSYGRGYESEVKTFDRGTLENGGDASADDGLIRNTHLANMSEGMTQTPEGLAVMHESGAKDYLGTGDEWVSPFMSILSPEQSGMPGSIEVQPETLRDAATNLGRVEAALSSAGSTIHAIHLPTSALGQVEGAADFAKALNLHLDATGIWLKRSEISAGISIDGLRSSADEHERADTTTRSLYEWDREHLGLADKGKEAVEDVKEFGKDAKEKAENIDLTPWDGVFPG
ncbi:hypothetical protein ncot_14955 [Nocardioides sp. JQ2195]|uniref:hypothetical protein n=1 Tax=Nocardioides sp. JQ2195 TaxID=2592334 RepID=UPI00143E8083|nr:hypothetical protein [Nocardioides sp. JQ2195]QIX27749.1 hypothetical protein ncot_14955 [Nocardioides sp. JQ2195]